MFVRRGGGRRSVGVDGGALERTAERWSGLRCRIRTGASVGVYANPVDEDTIPRGLEQNALGSLPRALCLGIRRDGDRGQRGD